MEKIRKQTVRVPKWDMSGAERLAIWRHAQAVWSKRKTDPIKELKKMRREWK